MTRASYTPLGAGCPGSGGTPTITAAPHRLPWLGTTFTADLSGLPVSLFRPTLLLLSFGLLPAPIPVLPGCLLHVDPLPPATSVAFFPNASGNATWSIPIPNTPSLAGAASHNQAIVLDLGTLSIDSLSNAAAAVIGTR